MSSFSTLFRGLIFLIWGATLQKAIANQNILNLNCSYERFTPNSTYHVNLSKLLNSLASKTDNNSLFSNLITGPDAESNSTVYTQYSCRGDYSIDECNICVANATRMLSSSCPTSISAHIWYEDCKVYYSNVKFFGTYNSTSLGSVWLLRNDNKRVSFRDTGVMAAYVTTTIAELAKEVASMDTKIDKIQSFRSGVKYFGTKVVNFTTTTNFRNRRHVISLYQMVQCTPDLSVQDCNSCLTSMINQLTTCCTGSLGGGVETRNCFIRYETYPFYNVSVTRMTFLPPLFRTSNTTSNLLGRISLMAVIAIVAPASILLGLATFGIGLFAWKLKHKNYLKFPTSDDTFDGVEALQYSLDELKTATQDFSDDNKIGKGGFGCVYKGILKNGQEIAVKKLFKTTSQVEEEFKNEVQVLAKVQHNNLVRLLGFCMAEGKNLLVFEYVPNPSLDKLLFDAEEHVKLDWVTRFKIITGIARGLFYLHEESRHSIVHRDLKPANILLDGRMNPKIADFGLARFFGIKKEFGNAGNQRGTMTSSRIDPTYQSTRRGGGTPGYMAPECSPRGKFSVKTDVYSYGVMILEIISGKRNTCFYIPGLAEDLLSYSWIQWKEGNPLSLIDEDLASESAFPSKEMKEQVLMCIHIGLLCIQKDSNARPTMGMIVNVFSNYEIEFKKWARSICEAN